MIGCCCRVKKKKYWRFLCSRMCCNRVWVFFFALYLWTIRRAESFIFAFLLLFNFIWSCSVLLKEFPLFWIFFHQCIQNYWLNKKKGHTQHSIYPVSPSFVKKSIFTSNKKSDVARKQPTIASFFKKQRQSFSKNF